MVETWATVDEVMEVIYKMARFKDTEGKSHSELVIIAEHIEIKKGTE